MSVGAFFNRQDKHRGMATRQQTFADLGGNRDEPTVRTRSDGKEQCPTCNEWFSKIGMHWSKGSCPYPPISEHNMELLKGMMLGDGTLSTTNSNPRVAVQMNNLTFLKALSEHLGWLGGKVYKNKTATEQARDINKIIDSSHTAEDAHDYYVCNIKSHPQLTRFEEWYETGEIRFPCNLTVSPIALLMWYISDGGLNHDRRSENSRPYVRFDSQNESERPDTIVGALEEHGFTVGQSGKEFRLSVEDSEDFFDLIGHEPVLGFEYKWEYEDTECYDKMKKLCERAHTTQTIE
jgi:hypothetical protein